jgi:hypothetical protein
MKTVTLKAKRVNLTELKLIEAKLLRKGIKLVLIIK